MTENKRMLLRPGQLAQELGVSTTTLWRWRKDGDNNFPRPVNLGPRFIGWEREVVEAWLNSKRKAGEEECNEII